MKTFTEFLEESKDQVANLRAKRQKILDQKNRGMDSSGNKINRENTIHKELKNISAQIKKLRSSPVEFTPSGWKPRG